MTLRAWTRGTPLLWKFLGINVIVIGFVIIIVWLSVDYFAADYFVVLMDKYDISPVSSHKMFVSAVHRYLIWATVAAVLLAMMLSLLLTRRVLGPLTQMRDTTGSIAAGDYSHRVSVTSRDEFGQLAEAFNRMADSLQTMENLRKKLMIDVAHELRTPLTNIRGYLEALTDGVISPTDETYGLLLEETLRLGQLIEDILRLAQADAAKANQRIVSVLLEELINRVLDPFIPQFDSKQIILTTDFKSMDTIVKVDPQQMAQVLNNVLENALRYTKSGRTVRLSIERSSDEVRIICSNPADQLRAEDLPYIFERFYRGEKSRSREHGGAGIGLAIAKELVEAHNGTVGAEIVETEVRVWFALPLS